MKLGALSITLLVIFILLNLAFIGAYLFVRWRRRSFRHQSSPAPPIHGRDHPPSFSTADVATKELLYFFSLKPVTRTELDPHEPPIKDTDGSKPEEQMVDVFKLKEIIKGPSRLLSTIKEDKEEVESTPDVDFSVNLAEEDGNTKTVFSTPCDSPVYFTPVGSPSRDVMGSAVYM